MKKTASWTAAALAATILGSGVLAAQQQVIIEGTQDGPMMMPGMGGRPAFKTGSGRIVGRVVSSENGGPLRRAQVRLTSQESGPKVALTDNEGRFEFRELPAGRFTLNASKSGYVSVQYGQTRPFEQGRPIELADKQSLDKADIVMPRGGVISGRIVDEFGEPLADAMVMALRQTWSNGRRRLAPTGRSAQTNDLGQFRMYGLPPGEYYVSGTLRSGEFAAIESALASVTGLPGGGSVQPPGSGYAPTYFPGTTTAASAQRVTVAIGQETQNTDFALASVRLARVSGTVMTSDGKPLDGALVNAVPAGGGFEMGLPMMGSSGRTTKDGAFTLANVAPGDYVLNVRPLRITMSEGGGNTMTFTTVIGGPGAGAAGDAESAALPISVAGDDLTNVVVVTSKGASVQGRIVFEGGAAPQNVTGIRVNAASADGDAMAMLGGGGGATKPDGSFEVKGLTGRRLLRAVNLPNGWTMKAVRVNGDDVTDTGVELKPGQDISNVDIVLTSKTTDISGTVSGSNGAVAKEYTVVVFSEDPQHWTVPGTRWVTSTRPDQDGRFRLRNLPAGAYYAVAVDYIEQGSWGDPEVLERLKARGRRFSIVEGQPTSLDLKLVEGF